MQNKAATSTWACTATTRRTCRPGRRSRSLALGTLLLGAATLGIDATPIEGFDPQALDQELALNEKG